MGRRSGDEVRDADWWAELSYRRCEEWRLDEALYCARRSIELGCETSYFELGRAFEKMDRSQESIAAYQRAIDAGVKEAVLNQGTVLEFVGDTDAARRRYLEAIEAGDALGHIRFGQLAEKSGDVEVARTHYEHALAAGWPSAPAAMGALLAARPDWSAAEPYLRRAILIPRDADSRVLLAAGLRAMGRDAEADVLLTATDLDEPDRAVALEYLEIHAILNDD